MNPVTSPATLITLCRCARDKQGSVCLEKGGHVLGHLGGRASPDFLEVKLRPHRGALSPPPPAPSMGLVGTRGLSEPLLTCS